MSMGLRLHLVHHTSRRAHTRSCATHLSSSPALLPTRDTRLPAIHISTYLLTAADDASSHGAPFGLGRAAATNAWEGRVVAVRPRLWGGRWDEGTALRGTWMLVDSSGRGAEARGAAEAGAAQRWRARGCWTWRVCALRGCCWDFWTCMLGWVGIGLGAGLLCTLLPAQCAGTSPCMTLCLCV